MLNNEKRNSGNYLHVKKDGGGVGIGSGDVYQGPLAALNLFSHHTHTKKSVFTFVKKFI